MEYTIGSKVLDGWEIVRPIGAGSYGKVFEVRKTSYGVETVSALKVIRIPESPAEVRSALNDGMDEQSVTGYFKGFVDEILHEIAMMSAVKSHPNVVSYEDHHLEEYPGEIRWDILIRMELLTPLEHYLREQAGLSGGASAGTLPIQEVARLGQEIASALAFCQRKNIIHRDIKPENIFISETGQFKLGDFGVAKTAAARSTGGSHKGTERYMAPEVFLNQPYGPTVDIYSLGLVLYRLLNGGRLPFLPPAPKPLSFGDYENAQIKRMKGEPIPPPSKADAALAAIVLKACAFRSGDRFRSAAELQEALDTYVRSHPAGEPSVQREDLPAQSQEQGEAAGGRSHEKDQEQTIGQGSGGKQEGTVGGWDSGKPEEPEIPQDGTVGSWGNNEKPEAAEMTLEGTVGSWGKGEKSEETEMPPDGTVGGWGRSPESQKEPSGEPNFNRTADGTEKGRLNSPADKQAVSAGVEKKRKRKQLLLAGGLLICIVVVAGVIWFAKTRGNSNKGGQEYVAEYDEDGKEIKRSFYNRDGSLRSYLTIDYDENGNEIRHNFYQADGTPDGYMTLENRADGLCIRADSYDSEGILEYSYTYEYDAKGIRIKENRFDQDGVLESYSVPEFDRDGKRVRESGYSINGILEYIFEYDENERLIKWNNYSEEGELYSYSTYEYDGVGDLIKRNRYDADDTSVGYDVIEYDTSGNQVKTNYYDEDGILDWYEVNEYDVFGNPVKWSIYNADGTLRNVHEYDASGNPVKWSSYNADGTLDSVHEYDAIGNPIKLSCYKEDGTLDWYEVNEYDATGNCVKRNRYDADGTLESYTVDEYDENGDYLKSETYDAEGNFLH